MRYQYRTQGTCSSLIEFEIDENNIVRNVMFIGGCSGNTQGVSRLVEGMTTEQVIERLEGISCQGKPTSCPDQLAKAILAAKQQQKR